VSRGTCVLAKIIARLGPGTLMAELVGPGTAFRCVPSYFNPRFSCCSHFLLTSVTRYGRHRQACRFTGGEFFTCRNTWNTGVPHSPTTLRPVTPANTITLLRQSAYGRQLRVDDRRFRRQTNEKVKGKGKWIHIAPLL